MRSELLDDFRDESGWSAVASGRAELTLSREPSPHGQRPAARLRLQGRRRLRRGAPAARPPRCPRAGRSRCASAAPRRPTSSRSSSSIRATATSGGGTATRSSFRPSWQPLRIRSAEVAFAWGPAGGGPLRELAAIEIAIAAGPGGRGTVWLEDLRFEDLTLREPPRVRASSAAAGHPPERALDGAAATSWRSEPGPGPAWLALDFRDEHEYGGLVIDWAAGAEARAFDVQASDDGEAWRTLWSAQQAEGPRHYVYLPGGGRSRWLRLLLLEAAGSAGVGIASLRVESFEFSRSLHDFFHAVAARERRGLHPRWLHREQTYWTPVGVDGAAAAAILNEEGMLEPDRASFSLEPFLFADGELVTWADAEVTQSLAQGYLPLPSSHWRWRDLAADLDRLRERARRERRARASATGSRTRGAAASACACSPRCDRSRCHRPGSPSRASAARARSPSSPGAEAPSW